MRTLFTFETDILSPSWTIIEVRILLENFRRFRNRPPALSKVTHSVWFRKWSILWIFDTMADNCLKRDAYRDSHWYPNFSLFWIHNNFQSYLRGDRGRFLPQISSRKVSLGHGLISKPCWAAHGSLKYWNTFQNLHSYSSSTLAVIITWTWPKQRNWEPSIFVRSIFDTSQLSEAQNKLQWIVYLCISATRIQNTATTPIKRLPPMKTSTGGACGSKVVTVANAGSVLRRLACVLSLSPLLRLIPKTANTSLPAIFMSVVNHLEFGNYDDCCDDLWRNWIWKCAHCSDWTVGTGLHGP